MKFRLSVAALMLGAVVSAGPVMAKPKMTDVAEAPTKLPTKVDMDPTHDPDDVLVLDLSNGGRVLIRLMPQWAPKHVERIQTLTRQGFYDGVIFHRVIDDFMAQTGDPTGTGQGGSKLPDLEAEFNDIPNVRGTVAMARTNDPNSANSQFFIDFYPRFSLDHNYTVFGRVIAGMNFVDEIHRGEPPKDPTKILQASLYSQNKPAPAMPAPSTDAPVTLDQLGNGNPAPARAPGSH
ncbi:peptidylprolyl isomerase [Novosphingobium sp. 1949]|uniref:Peptidyl-prolyl cis-trans isomerase n=1 Tax=Novosphingobium organovorum TaxID=2930092 RepID=A0ABT0B9J5_9SPHN|nr:peptidylprolyl isomerase [Novosphingobium organovorum]MCJ2181714.1 peptidylprolyl isomerase [Novosphingobium organovorum]